MSAYPQREAPMQTASTRQLEVNSTTVLTNDRSTTDLKFISDLGRSLLLAVHPKKAAHRVAEALRERFDASICGFAAELGNIGLICSAVTSDGEVDTAFNKRRLERWIGFMPPQVAYAETEIGEFMLGGAAHTREYISP